MTHPDDIAQKLKGKAQQIKGKFKQQTGQSLSGSIDEIKGKFNETVADIKMAHNTEEEL